MMLIYFTFFPFGAFLLDRATVFGSDRHTGVPATAKADTARYVLQIIKNSVYGYSVYPPNTALLG